MARQTCRPACSCCCNSLDRNLTCRVETSHTMTLPSALHEYATLWLKNKMHNFFCFPHETVEHVSDSKCSSKMRLYRQLQVLVQTSDLELLHTHTHTAAQSHFSSGKYNFIFHFPFVTQNRQPLSPRLFSVCAFVCVTCICLCQLPVL